MVDQYKSSKEDYTNDIVITIIGEDWAFKNGYLPNDYIGYTRSDLQGEVEARCRFTGEDANELLSIIDNKLGIVNLGI